MMLNKILVVWMIIKSVVWIQIKAECTNGCSGHGICTMYDMCICYRNWQENDCSEKVCPFGLAIVDTPKGDLDSSNTVEGPDESLMVVNDPVYVYGTTEQYPIMEDSDLNVIMDSAHGYMECSNVGECNRQTGECECDEGYEGTACDRQVCPGYPMICSGRGVCRTAYDAAKGDMKGEYLLWDKKVVVGCNCDAEYFGGDCSLRRCPIGVDPLYMDDVNSYRIATIYFAVLTTANSFDFSDGMPEKGTGYWAIRFYDLFGKAWLTDPIPAGASCTQVVAALEGLPNNVVPSGHSFCLHTNAISRYPLDDEPAKSSPEWTFTYLSRYRFYFSGEREMYSFVQPTFWLHGYTNTFNKPNLTSHDDTVTGDIYRIQFLGNPGQLPQPEIDIYLDGKRPSLTSSGKVVTATWSDGQQGDTVDYFTHYCAGVLLIVHQPTQDLDYYLLVNPPSNLPLLKQCLGSADNIPGNEEHKQSIYGDWEPGSPMNPHVVKLKRAHTDHLDGGYFAFIYFVDEEIGPDTSGYFKLMHPFISLDNVTAASFYVFATEGYAQVVGNQTTVSFDYASRNIYATNVSFDTSGTSNDGDVACESMKAISPTNGCLERNDKFFIIDPFNQHYNPHFLNLYTVKALHKAPIDYSVNNVFPSIQGSRGEAVSHYYHNIIETDISTNWAAEAKGPARFMIFKFVPSPRTTTSIVAECSNRGVCNNFEGLCDCFRGYSGPDCGEQVSLLV